jgi:hypothetical protein
LKELLGLILGMEILLLDHLHQELLQQLHHLQIHLLYQYRDLGKFHRHHHQEQLLEFQNMKVFHLQLLVLLLAQVLKLYPRRQPE